VTPICTYGAHDVGQLRIVRLSTRIARRSLLPHELFTVRGADPQTRWTVVLYFA